MCQLRIQAQFHISHNATLQPAISCDFAQNQGQSCAWVLFCGFCSQICCLGLQHTPSHPRATPEPPPSHPRATPEPPASHSRATPEPPPNHPRATPQPPPSHTPEPSLSHPRATPEPPPSPPPTYFHDLSGFNQKAHQLRDWVQKGFCASLMLECPNAAKYGNCTCLTEHSSGSRSQAPAVSALIHRWASKTEEVPDS